MGLNFAFATASQIIFGNNSLQKLPALVSGLGQKILFVTGNNTERAIRAMKYLDSNLECTLFQVPGEPCVKLINKGVVLAREKKCQLVIGLGGGSVIDAAKAIAALATNRGDLTDYLEVIGKGKPLEEVPLPCIAVPTTSGTGAEVTKNSVIKSKTDQVKVSLRSDLMYPNIAIIDPVLTLTMSPELTARTGVDALTHLMETFVSNQSNPFIDTLCMEGLRRVSSSLVEAYTNGDNLRAREDMAMASMLGGMALANVKLGAIHGFAGPMGGMFEISHGAICAGLMAATVEINVAALKEQKQDTEKFNRLAQLLTGNDEAMAEDAVIWLSELVKTLKIPKLSDFGIRKKDFPDLVVKAKNASSMKGNPLVLSDEQLNRILEKSM